MMPARLIRTILLVLLAIGSGAVLAQGQAPNGLSSSHAEQPGGYAIQESTGVSAAVGTGFTYQGRLTSGGVPAHGTCDLRFELWDAPSGGSQLGATQTLSAVSVSNGLFTVLLNASGEFGVAPFDGAARYLALAVRCPAGSGAYTALTPRQELTAAPYAHHARDADRLDGSDASAFQQRVTGSCPTGGAIRAVNADGSVECQAAGTEAWAAPRGRVLTTALDTLGNVGRGTAVAVGADGLGLVAYRARGTDTDELRVAHCQNAACTTATVTTVATPRFGETMVPTSLAIGADGLGLIATGDTSYLGLGQVIHCENAACSSATTTVVCSGEDENYPALTIGTDGLGLMSCTDHFALRLCHCTNPACTDSSCTIIDSVVGGEMMPSTSVAIGDDGLGLVAYSRPQLTIAHCDDIACTSATKTTIGSVAALYPSLTIGGDGLGLVAYVTLVSYPDYALRVAHCENALCTSATISTIDSGEVGFVSSATIAADGLGLISYYDRQNRDLNVAHCANAACTSATKTVVDSLGDVGQYSSIALDSEWRPLITYYDDTSDDLRVAHCGDPFCRRFR